MLLKEADLTRFLQLQEPPLAPFFAPWEGAINIGRVL
jgi:hypothetical protein